MYRKYGKYILPIIGLLLLLAIFNNQATTNTTDTPTVTIAIPYDLDASGIPDSYYVAWLEEQTGIHVEIEYISQNYTNDYIKLLFSNNTSNIDAVLFTKNNPADINDLEMYFDESFIEPLNSYINSDSYIQQAFDSFTDYDLQSAVSADNGSLYYMPSLTLSQSDRYLQTTWINVDWLEEIGMEIPSTTDEFTEVLTAFQAAYPEAVPIIGSYDDENSFICNYLLNAFTICDPENYYFAVDDDNQVFFAPTTDAWKEGLLYCKELYEKELLIDANFTYSEDELISLVNDPDNVVGMFSTKSISDVIYEDSSQLLSYFLVCSPLNDGYTTVEQQLPEVGGFILNSSENKELAFQLLDFMCSEEAYLIGHYGEYDVNWNYSSSTDISVLGEPAVITINSTDTLNRNPNEENIFGPFITDTYYADYITWNGYQVNQDEYLQARAYSSNTSYEAVYYLGSIDYSVYDLDTAELSALAKYVKTYIKAFTTGELKLNDTNWNEYISGFDNFDLDDILDEISNTYNGG